MRKRPDCQASTRPPAGRGDDRVKFFLPHAHDASEQRKIYSDLRDFLAGELGACLADQKIFRLTHRHGDEVYAIEVGKVHPLTEETVEAILHDESIGVYYLCTRTHGMVRGHPMAVGAADVESVALFDD